ncbi:hypothetical protein LASUN_06180 [Lentilactobacillus sunkii]|jgi:hypothetical protein|uniref:Uncharacterized protein n=1 Tax=Lentilactobacillus sunkii TaxID=481719 RepID=A0A1E7XG21_9LACO|nr:hypothetical protein LASUN_06180 [Lentilactobacillus sunkii]
MKNKRKKSLVRKVIYSILVIALLLFLVSTISPKNAVRATMLVHGASPVSTFRCNPVYAPKTSKSLGENLYSISNKYAYKNGYGTQISLFHMRTYWGIFHFATPTIPFLP